MVFQPGVGRFEPLLDAVGLGGAVSPGIKRTVLECGEIRNCIVHRDGLADKRLKARCPWLTTPTGEKLIVTDRDFGAYTLCGHWYVLDLSRRWGQRVGVPAPGTYIEVLDEIEQKLSMRASPGDT